MTFVFFNKKGICINFIQRGLRTLNDDCKRIRLLKWLFPFWERWQNFKKKNILERVNQGVRNAGAKGIYEGWKKGISDDRNRTLNKHKDIVTCLNSKMKISEICRLTGKHRATVYKVKVLI